MTLLEWLVVWFAGFVVSLGASIAIGGAFNSFSEKRNAETTESDVDTFIA